jgi:glycosyltransferase involved in cell wall biosynthesis
MAERILLFQPYYDLKGHFKSFFEVNNRVLSDHGFECYSVLGRERSHAHEKDDNDYIYNGDSKLLRILHSYKGLKKLKKLCVEKEISIIHLLDFEIITLCVFLLFNKNQLPNIKLILTLHSVNYLQESSNVFKAFYRKCIIAAYKHIDKHFKLDIITNGDTITDLFTSVIQLKDARIITSTWGTEDLSNGIDLNKKKENSFLFLGIIRRDKNIEYLLNEFATIEDDFTLTIAGMPFGYEIEELEALVEKSGIPDSKINVKLQFLTDSDYSTLLAEHQFIVLPYKQDNKSNSGPLIQALQFNVIPIVSNYGERAQITRNLNVGYTFSFEDDLNLRDIVDQILAKRTASTDTYIKNIVAEKDSFLWKNLIERLIVEQKVYSA